MQAQAQAAARTAKRLGALRGPPAAGLTFEEVQVADEERVEDRRKQQLVHERLLDGGLGACARQDTEEESEPVVQRGSHKGEADEAHGGDALPHDGISALDELLRDPVPAADDAHGRHRLCENGVLQQQVVVGSQGPRGRGEAPRRGGAGRGAGRSLRRRSAEARECSEHGDGCAAS